MSIAVKTKDKAITRRLIDQIITRLPELKSAHEYELEGILGSDYWQDEDDSHLALGIAFSKLVSQGRVPFECAGWTGNRHNKYRYRP